MRKIICTALVVAGQLASASASAYSSLSVGVETLRYQELTTFINPTNPDFGKTLKTVSTISSPVYRTSSLTKVNEQFEFSLDASSTLLPQDDTEVWTVDGILRQTNQVDMLHSSITLTGHYLLNKNHRFLAGPSYTLNTFRRFGFADPTLGVLEERSASVILNFGYGYESERSASKRFNYSAKILAGIPVYQLTENTAYPGFEFTDAGGYNIDIEGSVTYGVFDKLQVGVFASYSFMKRDGERIYTTQFTNVQSIVWPDNETRIITGGLILVWDFGE
ncbi:MAG: hypothetical protein JKX83_03805 [Pseudomonadales bacterium]|nr:hypothetical protein [Pseudomonadales bacterium]